MSLHSYPTGSLAGDYCRAGFGLVMVSAPLLLVPLTPTVAAVFGVLAVLFLLFGARTVLRQFDRVEVNDTGIASLGPFPKRIDWTSLEGIKLAYYATRRDGANGWMQLALKGGGRKVTLDSRIDGFDAIAACAANLVSLGIPLPAEGS
jgi:hypothetical protein